MVGEGGEDVGEAVRLVTASCPPGAVGRGARQPVVLRAERRELVM